MEHGSFHDLSDDLTGRDLVALGNQRFEIPFRFSVQSRCGDSTGDEVSHLLVEDLQRPLDSVVDGVEQSGSELDCERTAGVDDRLSGFDTGRVLVNLDDCLVADDLDDLSHQLLVSHLYDIIHTGGDTDGGHDRSCDSVNIFKWE